MAASRSQMNALLRRLEGPVREAFASAIRTARGRAKIAALIKAIELGDMDAVVLAAGIREGMWSALTEGIRSAYAASGLFVITADLPKRFSMDFDINNPRAESWLRVNSSQLVTGLNAEQRGAIQTMLTDGMLKGKNPRTVALDIVGRVGKTGSRAGGVLGLTETQASYVVNMGDILENNPRRYLIKDRDTGKWKHRFTLSDKRFDSAVLKAIKSGKPIPLKTRMKITSRYADKMLKHRGDNIARTETLQALNEANDEALRQIVDDGLAPRNAVTRIWHHSFGANEREGHLRMNGQERGIDEFFFNPITGVHLKHPGGSGLASEDVNCRCFVEHKIDFIAVELAA